MYMDYVYGALNLLKLKNCGCIDFERMDKNINLCSKDELNYGFGTSK